MQTLAKSFISTFFPGMQTVKFEAKNTVKNGEKSHPKSQQLSTCHCLQQLSGVREKNFLDSKKHFLLHVEMATQ
jgi:hypothetical protein